MANLRNNISILVAYIAIFNACTSKYSNDKDIKKSWFKNYTRINDAEKQELENNRSDSKNFTFTKRSFLNKLFSWDFENKWYINCSFEKTRTYLRPKKNKNVSINNTKKKHCNKKSIKNNIRNEKKNCDKIKYNPISNCPNCDLQILESELKQHEKNCVIACNHCHEKVKGSEIKQHATTTCKTECIYCFKKILSNQLKTHIESCVVQCPYCLTRVSNKNFEIHTNKCKKKGHRCDYCKEKINGKLIEHQKNCHVTCEYCGEEILGSNLSLHTSSACKKRKACPQCDYVGFSEEAIQLHMDRYCKTPCLYCREIYFERHKESHCCVCKHCYSKLNRKEGTYTNHLKKCKAFKKCTLCKKKVKKIKQHKKNCIKRCNIPSIKNNAPTYHLVTDIIKEVFKQDTLNKPQQTAQKKLKKMIISDLTNNKTLKNKIIFLSGQPGTGKSWFANKAQDIMEVVKDGSTIKFENIGVDVCSLSCINLLEEKKLVIFNDISFEVKNLRKIIYSSENEKLILSEGSSIRVLLKMIYLIDKLLKEKDSPIIIITTNLSKKYIGKLKQRLDTLKKNARINCIRIEEFEHLHLVTQPVYDFIKYFENNTIYFENFSRRKLLNNKHNLFVSDISKLIDKSRREKMGNIVFIPISKINEVKTILDSKENFSYEEPDFGAFEYQANVKDAGLAKNGKGNKSIITASQYFKNIKSDLDLVLHQMTDLEYLLIVPVKDKNMDAVKDFLAVKDITINNKGNIDLGLLDRYQNNTYYIE